MKKKVSSTNCRGVPRPQGEIIYVTDACDVGGGGTLYQWQELKPAELFHCQFQTSGLNRDGTLKHDYPANEWRLVSLCTGTGSGIKHNPTAVPTTRNFWLGRLCFLPSRVCLALGPFVWLCDQDPVKTFQKGLPPEKAKLKRWWTYLSQFRLTVNNIQGIKNEMSEYISRNNYGVPLGESSEALAKEAFQHVDVQLDLSMRTAVVLEGWSLTDYHA